MAFFNFPTIDNLKEVLGISNEQQRTNANPVNATNVSSTTILSNLVRQTLIDELNTLTTNISRPHVDLIKEGIGGAAYKLVTNNKQSELQQRGYVVGQVVSVIKFDNFGGIDTAYLVSIPSE